MSGKMMWGLSLSALGLLISLVPNLILKTCAHCLGMGMKCPMGSKTEFLIGAMILLLALLSLVVDSSQARMGLSMGIFLLAILAVCIATILVGFCDTSCHAACLCSPAKTPAMAVLGGLTALCALLSMLFPGSNKK